jgi:hypothetical protein
MVRRPLSRLFAATAALLAVTACDESAVILSSGTASTLQVTAFVDVDGDGTLGAGDQTIAGLTITATGAASLTATTGADGIAAFAGLTPGTYTLSVSGDVPTGAVLATAGNLTVVAPFQGAELTREFRYAFAPGEITGRLFRDDNGNGEYDADTDLAAAGIRVTATRQSDSEQFSTTTDAEGVFLISLLRPGTYVVTFDLPTDANLVGGDDVTVVVGSEAAVAIDAEFEGELLIDIADARTAPLGQSVTVEGVISWAPSFDDRVLFVQDATGGLSVFDFGLPDGLQIGDQIRMTGAAGAFDGERQIGSITAFEVLSSGPPPVPIQVTGATIAAGQNLGQLVTINGTVEQVDVLSFGNQMILLRDENGDTFTVYADSRTGVEDTAWQIGELYGVTGPLGTDENVGGTDLEDGSPNRVEVRGLDDVQAGGATVAIADARAALGVTVAIQGVITWAPSFDDRVLFIQDATGGITTFDFDLDDFAPIGGFEAGQLIRAVATVGAFRGEAQLGSFSSVEVLGTVPVPAPMGVTGASINAGDDQGELVTITATVDAVENPSFDNQLVTMTDGAGTTFTVYSDGRTGLQIPDWTVGTRYRVTGVLGFDDRNTPAAQLEPRGPADLVEAPGTNVSVAEARVLAGETVTVSGTVSRRIGWSGGDDSMFIQDESGGITVFGFSGVPAVSPGDVVEVTGEIGAFRGEVQIGTDVVTVTSTGGPAPTPIAASGDQINGGLFQGQLVTYSGTVTIAEEFNSFGTASLGVTDAFGTTVTVFVDNRSGLSIDDFSVGQELVIVAVPGFFDGNDPGAQLEVIIDTDVTFVN